MSHATLTIDIQGYWHAGGGRGAGAVLDAVVHKDNLGLPLLPGRHLKGLLRDALHRAALWGWDGYDTLAERLFGQTTENHSGEQPPSPGCLRVSDARLPDELAAWLGSAEEEAKNQRAELFRSHYVTAIEHESGTAKTHSLRGIEVTIPLQLQAVIAPLPGREPPLDWIEKLHAVLPLIDAVGAHRSRGLGRAQLMLKEVKA